MCRKAVNCKKAKEGELLKIIGGAVIFEECDSHFVEKFTFPKAMEIVHNFISTNSHPFIFDTYQLSDFINVSRKRLFVLSRFREEHYKVLKVIKKNGKYRTLKIPDEELKDVQKKILRQILLYYDVSEYATAYERGSTLYKNAVVHKGKKYLLKMDISDFFDSITSDMVHDKVFNTKYFPKHIGSLLTQLCCNEGCLPQGAPSSPKLSNIVMADFDGAIGRWCSKKGVSYTRYCDDLTFSSDEPLYNVYVRVKSMLEEMGFEVNENKTGFFTNACRQSVTGLTVNEKVRVSREYKRKLRQEIYYTLKYGPSDVITKEDKKEFVFFGEPEIQTYMDSLIGRTAYVLQIEPANKSFDDFLKKLIKLKKELNREQ